MQTTENTLDTLLGTWDGEELIIRRDQPTGATIIIAVHSTRLGPACGGTRMKTYPRLEDAVFDAQRLAEGMTNKFAAAGLQRGGGKAVIAVPSGLDAAARDDLLRRYGSLIHQLGGIFACGADVGTTAHDMDTIAETGAPFVFGRTSARGGSGDPSPATAIGVLSGIKTTCSQLFGSDALAGRHVVVQGAGKVGYSLMGLLRAEGAEVTCGDVEESVVEKAQAALGVIAIAADAVFDTACDIFSPCALGAILNSETIPRLRCRAVVGAANNQLATPQDAERLRERNILYAPDFVVNSGGAIYLIGREVLGWPEHETLDRVRTGVHDALTQVYALADTQGMTTSAAAELVARQRIADLG
jgi:leucine dehydrogenase